MLFFIVGIFKAVFSYYLYFLSIFFIQCDLLKIENFLLILAFLNFNVSVIENLFTEINNIAKALNFVY